MPEHEHYPFSVSLQHDSDMLEELGLQRSEDGRSVTYWVSEDLMQKANVVRWQSNGLGQPSKMRILTERAHVVPRYRHAGTNANTRSCSVVNESCVRRRHSVSRIPLRTHCTECEAFELSMEGRILTIKVEVLMPSEKRPPSYASGSLPIRKGSPVGDRKIKVPCSKRRNRLHPYSACRRPMSISELIGSGDPEASASTIVYDGCPPTSITFYFRAKPKVFLPLDDSMPCSFLPLQHSSSPFIPVRSRPECVLPSMRRSRSPRSEASSSLSETSTKVGPGPPTCSAPTRADHLTQNDHPDDNDSTSLSSERTTLCPSWTNARKETQQLPVGQGLELMKHIAAQRDLMSGFRLGVGENQAGIPSWNKFGSIDDIGGQEKLLMKVEQGLLETQRILLELRKIICQTKNINVRRSPMLL